MLVLADNHRSGRAIVEAAAAVIGNDEARSAKTLRALIDGGRVHGASFATPQAEAAAIVERIERHLTAGVPPHEIAIISRAGFRNDAMTVELKTLSVPWFDRAPLGHNDSWETLATLALTKLAAHRDDSDAIALLVRAMDQSGLVDDGYDAAIRMRSALGPAHAAASLADVQALRERAGLSSAVARAPQESERRRADRNLVLLDKDLEVQLQSGAPLLRAVSCFLGEGAVQVCSTHAVKGREFDVVFMMGLEDDVLPSSRCHGDKIALSQERRVFYVSLTRARHEVRLSYAKSREWKGRTSPKTGSRFLGELPRNSIHPW